jgi:hypothetical protein
MSFLFRDSQIQGSLNDLYLNLDYNITDALVLTEEFVTAEIIIKDME